MHAIPKPAGAALLWFSLLAVCGVRAVCQDGPTLTVINGSTQTAIVKVVGPNSGQMDLTPGARRTVGVSGGTYVLRIRYCDRASHCRYAKLDPFTVTQTAREVEYVTITLRSRTGNAQERESSPAEFNGGSN
jgi:hypothetical protein